MRSEALWPGRDEMAKNRKTAKITRAKRKGAKKSSAKAARSKRVASKRSAGKRAKTKVAKRKTPKRTAPARTTREDPCQREREARDRVGEEINSIQDALGEPDIPDDVRKKLEQTLARKQGRLRFLQQRLDECEAKHTPA
jgi:hypothetical protein